MDAYQKVNFLSMRGAHPVCRRGGHYFFAYCSYQERQAMQQSNYQKNYQADYSYEYQNDIRSCHGYFSVIGILS